MIHVDPIAVCVMLVSLWFGGPLLAISHWSGRRRLGAAIALGLAVLPAAAPLLDCPTWSLLPVAALGVARLLVESIRMLRRPLSLMAASRGCQGAAFLVLPLAVCMFVLLDQEPEVELPDQFEMFKPEALSPGTPISQPLYTDRGRAVTLYQQDSKEHSDEYKRTLEKRLAEAFILGMIRTATADLTTNCHGWIFADGRFWVSGADVDSILSDNDYQPVERPVPGDLVVYRAHDGTPAHTGIVRLASESGITIESKWGHMGRYLHPPERQPYGSDWAFYRSPRNGHLLAESDPTIAAP